MNKRKFGSYKEYWESLKGKIPISIQMQRDRGIIKTICGKCYKITPTWGSKGRLLIKEKMENQLIERMVN